MFYLTQYKNNKETQADRKQELFTHFYSFSLLIQFRFICQGQDTWIYISVHTADVNVMELAKRIFFYWQVNNQAKHKKKKKKEEKREKEKQY